MSMLRAAPARVSLALLAITIFGCGGEKTDFSLPPKSYTLADLTPNAVGDAVLQGVSDDGRVVGTYLKTAGQAMQPFGWTPDGDTADFVLPAQCKQMDGINEIGQIACSDQTVTPAKIYLWQTSSIDELTAPTGSKQFVVGGMSFSAGTASTITVGAKTDAYQLKPQENPVAFTTSGAGQLLGCSQDGNLVGVDSGSGHAKGFAVVDGKKRDIVATGGTDTFTVSVNDTGMVVGYTADTNTNHKAFSWQGGTFKTLAMTTGATESIADDVNNEGIVAGKVFVGGLWQACVWFPGKSPMLVKDMTTVPNGVVLNEAKVVTPLGIVVCLATKKIGGVDHSAVCVLRPNY